MKGACASASDPTVHTPRSPVTSPPTVTRQDRTASEIKLPRASSASRRSPGVVRGASYERLRKGHKMQSPQSSGDAEPSTAWRSEMRRSTHALRDARNYLNDLHQKALAGNWGPDEVRAATARAAQLLREAEKLQRSAAELQGGGEGRDRGGERGERGKRRGEVRWEKLERGRRELEDVCPPGYMPGDAYEPPLVHELRMEQPCELLAPRPPPTGPGSLRSKSELELSRRLSESLDMQERLAADNADLDVKRYILYKELMVKDQRLETARAQTVRLQAELKLLARDNARLQAIVSAPHPPSTDTAENTEQPAPDPAASGEPREVYVDLEKQLNELEADLQVVREMASTKHVGGPCGGQPCKGGDGQNVCFEQPAGMPPMPPMQRDCKICPPCPASCNPDAPLVSANISKKILGTPRGVVTETPAEKEVIFLKENLKTSEDECKSKIAECALLRSEVLQRKEEAERERCVAREAKAKLRTLELKFQGLAPVTSMQGPPEKAFSTEVNVQTLRQLLRAAYSEIEDQQALIKEMEVQLQDYRVKYLQAQQLSEEQTRQMAALDAENVRISEQINYEIQRVKIKFQVKLQELAPLPSLLQATHRQLQDAQQQQALAEHRTEQLARELNCSRDKIAVLTHQLNKPVEKPQGVDRAAEEKLLAATQQRVQQLTEANNKLKAEIDRLKTSLIRLEESLNMANQRYQERVDENKGLLADQAKIREEAERAILRANSRTDTIRKCMQTTIAELERQLAVSRALVATASKEREELRLTMENQISRLQDNCEIAQRRVRGLVGQVSALKKMAPEAETAPDTREPCVCVGFFVEETN